jgi:hypothetical protein
MIEQGSRETVNEFLARRTTQAHARLITVFVPGERILERARAVGSAVARWYPNRGGDAWTGATVTTCQFAAIILSSSASKDWRRSTQGPEIRTVFDKLKMGIMGKPSSWSSASA